uniref:Protein yellow n=1 Tax=Cacopsylla melanoneura TaxID=428564 RepID=A0A8D8VW47_9HEMI
MTILFLLLVFLVVITFTPIPTTSSRLTEVFHWRQVDFAFATDDDRRLAKARGQFIPENNLPVCVEKWHDRVFLAVPRYKKGVPATLTYVNLPNTNDKTTTSPLLNPYPNWDSNLREARNLTSVVKIQSDPCDRLWVLDSGEVEDKREKPPSIQVYDLRQHVQIGFFQLKEKTDYTEESIFSNMMVDVTSANCEDAYVYLADSGHNHMVVYNYRSNDSHIIHHNYLHFDPLFGDFTMGDVNFQWQTGIYGMSLSPLTRDNFRVMYFHPLASTMEFAVTTKVLQNRSLDFSRSNFDFKVMGSRGPGSQSAASSLDEETGVIFYSLLVRSGVGCWNTFRGEEYNEKSLGLVAEDNTTLNYPMDVRVDRNGILWVLSNKLPAFLYSSLKPDEVNIRIFKSLVRNAIKGTVCDEM